MNGGEPRDSEARPVVVESAWTLRARPKYEGAVSRTKWQAAAIRADECRLSDTDDTNLPSEHYEPLDTSGELCEGCAQDCRKGARGPRDRWQSMFCALPTIIQVFKHMSGRWTLGRERACDTPSGNVRECVTPLLSRTRAHGHSAHVRACGLVRMRRCYLTSLYEHDEGVFVLVM